MKAVGLSQQGGSHGLGEGMTDVWVFTEVVGGCSGSPMVSSPSLVRGTSAFPLSPPPCVGHC